MAWKVEFERSAEKELERLDPPAIKRLLKFLDDRVAKSDNPRQIGAALKGRELKIFGSTASVTTASSRKFRTNLSRC
jgi:mRNA interferase RelE/StbE